MVNFLCTFVEAYVCVEIWKFVKIFTLLFIENFNDSHYRWVVTLNVQLVKFMV